MLKQKLPFPAFCEVMPNVSLTRARPPQQEPPR